MVRAPKFTVARVPAVRKDLSAVVNVKSLSLCTTCKSCLQVAESVLCGSAVVALSGSTCSALALFLVSSVFDDNTVACISSTSDLDAERLQRVHLVADLLGAC